MLSGEARLREILGRRAGSDRHRGLGTVLPAQSPIRSDHLAAQPRRQRRSLHQPAELGAGGSDRCHVLAGDALEDRGHTVTKTVGVE